MPQELGMPRYLPKDAEKGDQVVTAGEYCGHTMSAKYKNNKQHNFFEIGGDHVILGGGQLDWRMNQGQLEEGKVYDITFDGKEKIEKGEWAGTEAKQFKIAVYSKSEVTALLKDKDLELKGGTVKDDAPVEAVADVRVADAAESLDDLE